LFFHVAILSIGRDLSKCSTTFVDTLINLEQKGNMIRLKVQADANKPMTDMLGTMLVLKADKLFGITPKLDSYRKIFLPGAFSSNHSLRRMSTTTR